MSGSLQGAGGIGGLLASVRGGAGSPNTLLYTFDGNGNVSELLQVSSNEFQVSAHYEYSPFGETIVATGPEAQDNPFRFSTKYWDDESGLYYYGYRYYSPSLGRWLSRDPIGESMAASLVQPQAVARQIRNLYLFVNNTPVTAIDFLGLVIYGFEVNVWPNDQGEFGNSGAEIRYTYDCCKCKRVHFTQYAWTSSVIRWFGFWDVTDFRPWHYDSIGDQENFPSCPNINGWGRATMHDRPGYSETPVTTIVSLLQMFKTEAWCIQGPDSGKKYGVVNWGHYYSRNPYVVNTWHTP